MDDPIVLLAVLNILPGSLDEVVADITALRKGGGHPPFGGATAIAESVKETVSRPNPLEPFHTKEACARGLQELIGFGLVKRDGNGYRLNYEGVMVATQAVRKAQRECREHERLASEEGRAWPAATPIANPLPLPQKGGSEESVGRAAEEEGV